MTQVPQSQRPAASPGVLDGEAGAPVRHARALSALRAVWASRRHWQNCAEKLQDERDQLRGSIAAWHLHDRTQRARIAELEADRNVLTGQLRDSRARVTALKAAVAGLQAGAR